MASNNLSDVYVDYRIASLTRLSDAAEHSTNVSIVNLAVSCSPRRTRVAALPAFASVRAEARFRLKSNAAPSGRLLDA